ncbi:MAG: ribonuclease HI [Candidatus Poseidoniaceae archaeon]
MDAQPTWTIYVDGSCPANRDVDASTTASWAFVVVEGDLPHGRGSGEVLHEEAGPVLTDADAAGYLGAEVGSNNTAELSAFAHALRWLLLQPSDESALIRADSMYAGNLADGTWKPKANRALVARVRTLWQEVKDQREVAWDHVRAHRGHRWNERADHLAGRHALGEAPDPLSFWRPGRR